MLPGTRKQSQDTSHQPWPTITADKRPPNNGRMPIPRLYKPFEVIWTNVIWSTFLVRVLAGMMLYGGILTPLKPLLMTGYYHAVVRATLIHINDVPDTAWRCLSNRNSFVCIACSSVDIDCQIQGLVCTFVQRTILWLLLLLKTDELEPNLCDGELH